MGSTAGTQTQLARAAIITMYSKTTSRMHYQNHYLQQKSPNSKTMAQLIINVLLN